MTDTKQLKVLVLPEGDMHVAVCLDYGITVQAKTMKTLKERLETTLKAMVALAKDHGHEPFANLDQAPIYYWRLWESVDSHVISRVALTWPDCEWNEILPQSYELLVA